MTLPSKTQSQFVTDMTTDWAGRIGIAPSFEPGDPLLAIMESLSTQLVFLQGLVSAVLSLTRAQTSTGSDLDSWMNQFSFYREPATFAVGPVTLGRYTPASSPINVPAATLNTGGTYSGGTLVQTAGGAIVYQLIPDTTQSAYNATTNSYIMQVGQSSITATAQAVTAGSTSNVAAASLSQLGSTVAGIDIVSNQSLINDGANAQSDASLLAAFPLYLGTLAKATQAAIIEAASQVQQGLFISTAENQTPSGGLQNGAFTVFVDNGTGSPPSSLLSAVYAAVYAVRAFTVRPFVAAPTLITVNVNIQLGVLASANQTTVLANVTAAIVAYINSLPEGATLYTSMIEQTALKADPNVVSVKSGTTLNSANADLISTISQVLRTTAGNVSTAVYVSPSAPPSGGTQ